MAVSLDALAEPVVPVSEPPSHDLTPRQWVRANLASTPANAALTVVVGAAAAWVAYRLARWVFVTGDWGVVRTHLRLFIVGRFPADELWRLWVSGYVVAATVGLAFGAVGAAAVQVPRGDGGDRGHAGGGDGDGGDAGGGDGDGGDRAAGRR
ncbi:MAG TPA: hypothetical protein VFI47_21040, partial [Acidimicrobiales bacterium]|nr:hypothetical protein [Acidimicrobiales bacterium]